MSRAARRYRKWERGAREAAWQDARLTTGAAAAKCRGKTTYQLAQHRNRFITKGTVVAQGEHLSFVVPGMAEYVLRRSDGLTSMSDVFGASLPGPARPATGAVPPEPEARRPAGRATKPIAQPGR
jgi:hypothetical protein